VSGAAPANRSFKLTVACSRRTRRAPAIKRRSLTPCPLGPKTASAGVMNDGKS